MSRRKFSTISPSSSSFSMTKGAFLGPGVRGRAKRREEELLTPFFFTTLRVESELGPKILVEGGEREEERPPG